MAFGRRQHNLTLLADGSVLATGGNSTGASLIDMNGGVYNAERWDPATGQWTTLAAQAVTRQYHSTALLLPDGRVLSAGGGICGTCDQVGYLAKNAEIFTPPYLFKQDGSGAARRRARDHRGARHGRATAASSRSRTPNAASITKVGLLRLGAADPLGRDGAALPAALLHGRRRHAHGDRPREHEHGRARLLHALHRRLERRSLGGQDPDAGRRRSSAASASFQPAADGVAHLAGERRELRVTGEDRAGGERGRRRRPGVRWSSSSAAPPRSGRTLPLPIRSNGRSAPPAPTRSQPGRPTTPEP